MPFLEGIRSDSEGMNLSFILPFPKTYEVWGETTFSFPPPIFYFYSTLFCISVRGYVLTIMVSCNINCSFSVYFKSVYKGHFL